MSNLQSDIAQDLLEAFSQFRRLHWRQSPIAGLTHAEIRLLMSLRKAISAGSAGVKVSEISSMLQVAPPTVTQQISELETQGYVDRAMDKEDRRAVRVSLTKRGELVIVQVHEDFVASFRGLVEYLGEEQSRQLADLLTKAFTYLSEVRNAKSPADTPGV
jgi:DNA-binding MarR family transcriptional regulator